MFKKRSNNSNASIRKKVEDTEEKSDEEIDTQIGGSLNDKKLEQSLRKRYSYCTRIIY